MAPGQEPPFPLALLGPSGVWWCLCLHFPVGNDIDCVTGARESLVSCMAAKHPELWAWGLLRGVQFMACLKRDFKLQSNLANRDSWKVQLWENLLWKRSLGTNPREFSAEWAALYIFPKAVFTATVQPWVPWFPPGVLSSAQERDGSRLCSSWWLPAGIRLCPVRQGQNSVNWDTGHFRRVKGNESKS